MTARYGPFAVGPGSTLTEDFWYGVMGPMLQHSGVSGSYGGSGLQVYSPVSALKVFVRPGSGLVRGVGYSNDADYEVDFTANGSGSPRIDRVVLRMDPTAHTCLPGIVLGTAGSGVAPALTQVVGGVWEIPLANVTIPAGATTSTSIATGNVADNRQYLPMPTRQFYSASGLPATDGSFGSVAWDATANRLMTLRAGTWQYVPTQQYDSGWQAVATPYFTQYESVGMRIFGEPGARVVWGRGLIAKTTGDGNLDVGVVAATFYPGPIFSESALSNGVTVPVAAFDAGGMGLPGWSLWLHADGSVTAPADVRLSLIPPEGSSMQPSTSYSLWFNYPLD